MTCYFFINKLVCEENMLENMKITIKNEGKCYYV